MAELDYDKVEFHLAPQPSESLDDLNLTNPVEAPIDELREETSRSIERTFGPRSEMARDGLLPVIEGRLQGHRVNCIGSVLELGEDDIYLKFIVELPEGEGLNRQEESYVLSPNGGIRHGSCLRHRDGGYDVSTCEEGDNLMSHPEGLGAIDLELSGGGGYFYSHGEVMNEGQLHRRLQELLGSCLPPMLSS